MKTMLREETIEPIWREVDFTPCDEVFYPSDDGLPMSDNTVQLNYIISLFLGFDDLYKDDPEVFVAGNLLWYPVKGQPKKRLAPDVMIAFNRPKGDRSSWLQWKEANVPPAFVMEVLSPSNTVNEMIEKGDFYLKHGVQEFIIYDPDLGVLRKRASGRLWKLRTAGKAA